MLNARMQKNYLRVTSLWPDSSSHTFRVLSSDEDTILHVSACKQRITPKIQRKLRKFGFLKHTYLEI